MKARIATICKNYLPSRQVHVHKLSFRISVPVFFQGASVIAYQLPTVTPLWALSHSWHKNCIELTASLATRIDQLIDQPIKE
jgi:hypothetical protein